MSKRRKNWPIILSLAALIVPGLLAWGFYALVNRGGAKAWAERRASLEAAGETLVVAELFPPPIPDSENFFAISLLHGIGVVDSDDFEAGEGGEKRARLDAVTYLPELRDEHPVKPSLGRGYSLGTKPNMAEWEAYLRETKSLPLTEDELGAGAILRGLDTAHGGVFKELAAGLDRPRARMVPGVAALLEEHDMAYSLSVPHFSSMTNLTKTLSFRASAAVAAGDRETARQSLAIMFRINGACRDENLLLAELVAVTGIAIFMSPVWESLEARIWEADDLRWLAGELEKIDLEKGYLGAMRAEMAFHVDALEYLKDAQAGKQEELSFSTFTGAFDGSPEEWFNEFWYLLPDGFFDQNKVTVVDWLYEFVIAPLKEGGSPALIAREPDLEAAMSEAEEERRFYSMFARLTSPVYGSIVRRIGYFEAVLAQARTAAALEWYFLERGAYPRSLDDLVPDFLAAVPLDPVSGDEIRYLRYVDGGRCRVWCVGWDGVDDGGARTLDPAKPEKTRFHDEKYVGDWVWSYAP